MTMEKQPFRDVSPVKNCNFPAIAMYIGMSCQGSPLPLLNSPPFHRGKSLGVGSISPNM